ncbi:MAG: nucleotidyltransferase family protein [Clostridia bacterium]|nr:nucleotidyltransferase family protein [Clostridia bacterium]
MKICAIICEFNPFHNGHKYLLDTARKLSGCDKVLCIMSGNFTQRGEICILDKFTRAKHAVLGGADCVIQLPAYFATAPAEIFAEGAVKILSSIPEVCTLAFGCESGNAAKFLEAAKILSEESQVFKHVLSEKLDGGESYIKSVDAAFEACGGDKTFIESPNNILGIEYEKAVLKLNPDIKLLPIERVGAGYNNGELCENFSSATAIRHNLDSPLIKNNVPDFVYEDLKNAHSAEDKFGAIQSYALISGGKEKLSLVAGCSEGLENKLYSLSDLPVENIIKEATNKRYSASRIRRILTSNALGIYEKDCKRLLNGDLYIKPLAVRQSTKVEMLTALNRSAFPVVIRQRDMENLSNSAKECFEKDIFESKVWGTASGKSIYDFTLLTI